LDPFATPGPSRSSAAPSSGANPVERTGKLVAKLREVPLDAVRAPDHDVIGAGYAFGGDELAGKGSQAALHTVADDRAADLLGYREADAHLWIAIAAIADQKHETGSGSAPAAVRGQKVGAFTKDV
jgi:hypothetical protein